MVEWNYVAGQAPLVWQKFSEWFLSMPIYGQIIFLIGVVSILILTGVLVYYILKGVAYLVYYILKGVYLLLKGIVLGIYRLFQEIYYAISGKPKPVKNKQEIKQEQPQKPVRQSYEESEQLNPVQRVIQPIQPNAGFCTECGNQFTEQMSHQLRENGLVYCKYCGQGYKAETIKAQAF